MGPAASGPAGRVAHRGEAGLVPGGDRQLTRPGAQGWPKTGPSPIDRAHTGSKHHVLTDAHGTPLAVSLTGGNRNDVTQLIPLLEAIPPVRGRVGRPRRRPDCLLADRGYDHDKYRRLVWAKGIKPKIARRGTAHGFGTQVHNGLRARTPAHAVSWT